MRLRLDLIRIHTATLLTYLPGSQTHVNKTNCCLAFYSIASSRYSQGAHCQASGYHHSVNECSIARALFRAVQNTCEHIHHVVSQATILTAVRLCKQSGVDGTDSRQLQCSTCTSRSWQVGQCNCSSVMGMKLHKPHLIHVGLPVNAAEHESRDIAIPTLRDL